jgi:3',5'-nucleoside bisphosphate phosphatase
MPARQPFTRLCQQLAATGRADLHLHTTCSDGLYAPAEIVDLGRRCGLAALAITDHDTLAALPAARAAAAGSGLEIVPGVEITSEHAGHELHLLAYFIDPDYPSLAEALVHIRRHRVQRFHEMIERLRQRGVSVEPGAAPSHAPEALGRRHLAEMLIQAGQVRTMREAFQRYLGDRGTVAVPKQRLPVAEALALVRGAGGVAALAHPRYDCTQDSLTELQNLGLDAVEAEYPGTRPSRIRELRGWADALGLAVTGGSDCHGPGRRAVGACTITTVELERLRQRVER